MVSEPSIRGSSSAKMVWATHGGCHPDLYSGDVYGGGARHLFDEMPSHREATTGDVLRVTVSHVLYPVTEGVLHQVFDSNGAEQVVVLERADHVEALVWFRSSRDAERARDVTHGRCVYDGCCWLDIQYMQPTPNDSIVVTPATCSTLGLSHNTDVLMAATTSAAATLTTSTTSAAATTTSLVTGAREAPRDELKELAHKETSEEPKKTVQELCEKILATLNSMIEGGHDVNLNTTSNVIEPAGYHVVSLPTPPTTVKLSEIIVSSPVPPVIADSVLDQDSAGHKVLKERSDMSMMVLWPPPMKMDKRQPCTLPVQVEVMGKDAELRLTPWLVFICYQGDSQSKQSWPLPPFHVEQQKSGGGLIRFKSSIRSASLLLSPWPPPTQGQLIKETSSAQYILQQYLAASGGQKLLTSMRNAYAMGKVRMVATTVLVDGLFTSRGKEQHIMWDPGGYTVPFVKFENSRFYACVDKKVNYAAVLPWFIKWARFKSRSTDLAATEITTLNSFGEHYKKFPCHITALKLHMANLFMENLSKLAAILWCFCSLVPFTVELRQILEQKAVSLFSNVVTSGHHLDGFAIVGALSASGGVGDQPIGEAVHGMIFSRGLNSELVLGNALIDMYGRCGKVGAALAVFDAMALKDEVTWGSMLHGYVKSAGVDSALSFFDQMPMKSTVSWTALITGHVLGVLSACADIGALDLGRVIHGYGSKFNASTNIIVSNALMDVVKELSGRIEAMEKKQAWSNKEVKYLQGVNDRLLKRVFELKDTVKKWNSKKIDPLSLEDSLNQFVEQCLGSEDVIYLIGGFDGISFLSSLDSFSPSLDILTPLPLLSKLNLSVTQDGCNLGKDGIQETNAKWCTPEDQVYSEVVVQRKLQAVVTPSLNIAAEAWW